MLAQVKYWRHPSFNVGGGVNHSVPGVNMQDVRTFTGQTSSDVAPGDRSKVSLLCVFFFFIWDFRGKLEADLRSVPELHLNTTHHTVWGREGDRGGGLRRANNWRVMTDWKNDTQSGRQADRRRGRTEGGREGGTEHSEARTALLKTQRSKSAKWSFSIYSHGFVVRRCFLTRGQRIKGVMCVFFFRKDWVNDWQVLLTWG